MRLAPYDYVLFLPIIHPNKVTQALLKTCADCDFALLKTPNTPNPKIVVLIVVVLVAIVEVLVPGVVRIVLGRTPVVVIGKTALNNEQRCFGQYKAPCTDANQLPRQSLYRF